MRPRAFAALAAVALLALPSRADAHAIGLSNGEYTARGSNVQAKLTFARGEVAQLVPELDANRDGHVTALEVQGARPLLDAKVLRGVVVRHDGSGAACLPRLVDAALTEQDGLVVEGVFACPSPAPVRVEIALLDELAHGHRHVARAIGVKTRDEVLYRDQRSMVFEPAPESTPVAAPAPVQAPEVSGAWSFFKMGIEHILTGYDHMVFLLGLVLLRARVRSLLAVVTAFTVAHSITLALATLGILAPSPKIVEPAIALSIAYVGIENFFAKDGNKRWRITFPFGLIHGFGFAGALKEVALPRAQVPTALVSFNLGVEVGQLAVMAFVLPLVLVLRDRQTWFDPRGVRVLSGVIAIAGGIWFISRVV